MIGPQATSAAQRIRWGQSTFGEFVGTVHDPTGSVVPNCVVKAVNLGTSAARSTLTDASGDYTPGR